MDLRNKTTSEFRTVFHSPLGVPNFQVSLYSISPLMPDLRFASYWPPAAASLLLLLLLLQASLQVGLRRLQLHILLEDLSIRRLVCGSL